MPSQSTSEDYYIYTAKAGDRWDTIAYRSYLSLTASPERLASVIIRANRRLGDIVSFEGGEQVIVPKLSNVSTPSTLAPWRRNGS